MPPLTGQARDDTIVSLMPLVRGLAGKVKRSVLPGTAWDDLISDGTLGAIQAVDRWEPDLGPLDKFASARIRGAMIDGFRARHGRETTARAQTRVWSLDAMADRTDRSSLADQLPDDEDTIARLLDGLVIEDALSVLPHRYAVMVRAVYLEGLSAREVSAAMGVTESRGSQILADARRLMYLHLTAAA